MTGAGQKLNTQRTTYREENVRRPEPAVARDPSAGRLPARRVKHYYDLSLLSALIFMFAIGLIILYSGSQYQAAVKYSDAGYFFTRQLKFGCIGLAAAIVISLLDYRYLKGFLSNAAYVGSVGILILTLVMGLASHGKTRWLEVGGLSFQPTELVKTAMIIFIAGYIAEKGTAINRRENWLRLILMAAVPAGLIGKENVSSGIILLMITLVMLFVALEHYKAFMALLALGVGAVLGLKPLIYQYIVYKGIAERPDNYLLRRIVGWAAPEIFTTDSYQTQQAIYAIGSGGITGQGLGNSIQKYGSIPEIWNDMIFSIVCEEFGFIGAAAIIIMYLYIIYRIYNVAVNARDLFGSMLCTGVMAHLSLQVVLNISVVTGVIPNTGVTLPFISYGGSAIVFTLVEMGLVLSVAHRIKT